MSILIKGKRMPKCCVECWAAEICRHYNRFSNYERPEHCPLVEVPEPHGRLIDAEMLSSQFHKDTGSLHLVTTHGFVSECIEDASTVIEAEGEEQCE